jgi:peptidoglycan hydrolase-like protein with peptidoglycan-binding domain
MPNDKRLHTKDLVARLRPVENNGSKKDIAQLHAALGKLRLDVSPDEARRAEWGASTTDMIQRFQEHAGLEAHGTLTPETVDRLKAELNHRFYADNKTRTLKLQEMLERVGHPVDPAEKKARTFGASTQAALRAWKAGAGLADDALLDDDVFERLRGGVLEARFTTKTQISQFHHKLLRAGRIAKLDLQIDAAELKGGELGSTTRAMITALQTKYGLAPTGELSPDTLDRIESIAASRPQAVKMLKAKGATTLAPLNRVTRLNSTNQHVGKLQETLAFLGYKIDAREYGASTFGKTTQQAVLAYQRRRGLPVSGHADAPTLRSLNVEITEANPQAAAPPTAFHMRGSVRDELWQGKSGMKVQVWEYLLRDAGTMLGERRSFDNGFYDVPYAPPIDPLTGQIKSPFHVVVKILDQANAEVARKIVFNPTAIAWANFTDGELPYRGMSEYEARMKAVQRVLKTVGIGEIRETADEHEVSYTARDAQMTQDDVMRLVLAHRVSTALGDAAIGPDTVYAFVRQNLPPSLPSDLLASTQEWTWIDQLVEQTANGLVFMDDALQEAAFENAVKENYVPVQTALGRATPLAALRNRRQTFALDKPILVGNGNLRTLLATATVDAQHHATIADTFLRHGGLGSDFWTDVRSHAAELGGEAVIDNLETTVNMGFVTKNHQPTLTFLQGRLNDPADTRITKASDLAKLSRDEVKALIVENGGAVPPNTDGDTDEHKIDAYAGTMVAQSERLFPSVAFAANVARSTTNGLQHVAEIQQLIDEHADLDLRTTNLDKFFVDRAIAVEPGVHSETRVMQRVHRIAPTVGTGKALLDARIHHSAQVVAMGKERLVNALKEQGVDQPTALTVYGEAEFQYAQVLTRLSDYRFELHRNNPQVILNHTYTAEEQQTFLGALPNLETLFGSLDYCDCSHCESVYSPSAYLADLLRFLDSHPSEQTNRTVQAILFDRRPDIQHIKLNCANTNTPLPYIDLVCEVLEHAVGTPDPAFAFQTTRSAEELRAFPANERKEAYDLLKTADYPMNSAFNLWQEEARLFLAHLGVPRWELMRDLQARPAAGTTAPSDLAIAAEGWGMSTHEATRITTAEATTARQDVLWGFDSSATQLVVRPFLDHSKLSYDELLQLLAVRWIVQAEDPNNLHIQRPARSCSVDAQTLNNVTVARLDQIHRFLRLWRHTGWHMWELDLLIRAPGIGNNTLDAGMVGRAWQFRQVQERLGLPFEQTLAFYGLLNTETRTAIDGVAATEPLYVTLFQNPAVINPVDPAFALPIAVGATLGGHRATLQAALALRDPELQLLVPNPNAPLDLANLARIVNTATLARSLGLTVAELQTLTTLCGIANPFASPDHTLQLIDCRDRVRNSPLVIDELAYLLTLQPDSPYGLREAAITLMLEALRESLRTSTASDKRGQIAAQVAASFGLANNQASALLQLNLGGVLADHLADARLTAKNAADQYTTPLTPANFPRMYESYRLLHKAAMLLQRYAITSRAELEWLIRRAAVYGGLDWNALPVAAAPAQPLWTAWTRLDSWLAFRAHYPQPEGVSLPAVFELAADATTPLAQITAALAKLTGWRETDISTLHARWGLQHNATSDYAKIETMERLARALRYVGRTGAPAATLWEWANRDDDTADRHWRSAQEIRRAVKSKYDATTWLAKVEPIQDVLRERKRTALVNYLVEHSIRTEAPMIDVGGKLFRNPRYWRDSNDLLSYFLIDVEMSACQPTSRIKQAISSVQMFVQRCFLNLEQPFVEVSRDEREDSVSLNSWKQWRWMKNYRLWEANRKVFLYPENWIEPELRDDKSPFFRELVSELLQNDLTDEHTERAFVHYLEKVNEVAHLDIAGVYYEVDDDNPYDNLPPNINRMHVIGRTRAQPAMYYYRRYDLNYNTWSAWEKIDLDITGNHVIPVVYNRRLHLFWLVFTEKPQKVRKQPPAKASDTPTNPPDPANMLELQLAWSVQRDGGWTTKKLSHQKLIHPWERPLHSYHFKPRYKSRENQLWLDVYISTSVQFNNNQFYDPYTNQRRALTSRPFDETGRPWHSSSFVFDGEVVDLKMKPLLGLYHLQRSDGTVDEALTPTNSHQYVRQNYGVDGRNVNALTGGYEIAPRLVLPSGMHYRHNRLANNRETLNPNKLNVVENGGVRTLLNGAHSPFEMVFSQDHIHFDTAAWGQVPFFYQDRQRAFFVKSEWQTLFLNYGQTTQQLRYTFFPFYHAYTETFLRELNRSGLPGLLNRRLQRFPHTYYPGNAYRFNSAYAPIAPNVPDVTAEVDTVDFSEHGAYAIYNWELFFHIPLMIATKLSQNQRFEEAMRWFHYIFDPTNVEALGTPQRFWITRPFFEQNEEQYRKQRIEKLLEEISSNLDQVRAWKNDPFNPHLIARYRPVAYQKNVVMKYIDNLIAWGDQLFRRDTMESINEAVMLYVLAYELLGRRPIKVANVERADQSYAELVADAPLDPFGNQRVDVLMENYTGKPVRVVRTDEGAEPLPRLDIFYFGIPANDKLLEYWNVVEDRLFKIRHCMNIQGVVRQLALFEPPIDPALLVKAAAAGVDISSVLADSGAPQGHYRFRALAAKAAEFCGEVRGLGERMLAALEKRDAEEVALLRSQHEVRLLEANTEVRKAQINDALLAIAGLEQGRASAEEKKSYFEGRDFINLWEGTALTLGGIAALAETTVAAGYILAGGLSVIPTLVGGGSGFGGSPHVTVSPIDGLKLSKAAESAVQVLSAISRASEKLGGLASTMGSYSRRQDEWDFQGRLATIEIKQFDQQIAAARVRHAIAERELANLEAQIEQVRSVDEYLHTKYTNQQLYEWMIGQLATIYFQNYQLAYDMAKRAQGAFRFELGAPEASFIQFGYWDSLKKGLLAADRLANDIRRMETAFIDQNTRDLELTKHVSLGDLAPLSLLTLKQTGSCTVVLPEWLFDMDYPGHYQRRVVSVGVTIPAVVGPYTNLNCTLSLVNNGIRVSDAVTGGYGDPLLAADTRFVRNPVPIQQIVTSHGQNDAGVFELNLGDERYLPFEGAGAVSEWRIDIPQAQNQWDLATISDLIFHVRYTAKNGSTALATAARTNLAARLPENGWRMFVLPSDWSTQWYRFFHPDPGQDQTLTLTLGPEHLPFFARSANARLSKVDLVVESTATSFEVLVQPPGGPAATTAAMAREADFGNRFHWERTVPTNPAVPTIGTWTIKLRKNGATDFRSLVPDDIEQAFLVVGFSIAP